MQLTQGFHGNLGDPTVFWRVPEWAKPADQLPGTRKSTVLHRERTLTVNRITKREAKSRACGMDCRKS